MSKSRAFGGGDVILVDVFSNKLRKQKKKLVSTNTCNPFNFSVDEARELTDEVETFWRKSNRYGALLFKGKTYDLQNFICLEM